MIDGFLIFDGWREGDRHLLLLFLGGERGRGERTTNVSRLAFTTVVAAKKKHSSETWNPSIKTTQLTEPWHASPHSSSPSSWPRPTRSSPRPRDAVSFHFFFSGAARTMCTCRRRGEAFCLPRFFFFFSTPCRREMMVCADGSNVWGGGTGSLGGGGWGGFDV